MISITVMILIITVIVSLGAFNSNKVMNDLIFYPPAVSSNNQYYRFFTSGFIHADYIHLIFNMLALYMFGDIVERGFIQIFESKGKILYLTMYLLALPIALLPSYMRNRDNYHYRSLGASGAVSAVVFAGLTIAPHMGVGLIFIPNLHIPGFVFGPLFLVISYYLDKKGGGNINHSAHIWGALFGVTFLIVVGKIFGFDAIAAFIRGVKFYFSQSS